MESWSWWQWAAAGIGVWSVFYMVGKRLDALLSAIVDGVDRTQRRLSEIDTVLRGITHQSENQREQLGEIAALLRDIRSALGKLPR